MTPNLKITWRSCSSLSTDSPQTSQRTWSFDFLCFEINLWRQFLGHVMRDGEELGDACFVARDFFHTG